MTTTRRTILGLFVSLGITTASLATLSSCDKVGGGASYAVLPTTMGIMNDAANQVKDLNKKIKEGEASAKEEKDLIDKEMMAKVRLEGSKDVGGLIPVEITEGVPLKFENWTITSVETTGFREALIRLTADAELTGSAIYQNSKSGEDCAYYWPVGVDKDGQVFQIYNYHIRVYDKANKEVSHYNDPGAGAMVSLECTMDIEYHQVDAIGNMQSVRLVKMDSPDIEQARERNKQLKDLFTLAE